MSRMEIPTKENLVRSKTAPTANFKGFHSLTKGNQVSLVRIHFSPPESDGKLAGIGGGGRNGILSSNAN